jgi:hypothetical protein
VRHWSFAVRRRSRHGGQVLVELRRVDALGAAGSTAFDAVVVALEARVLRGLKPSLQSPLQSVNVSFASPMHGLPARAGAAAKPERERDADDGCRSDGEHGSIPPCVVGREASRCPTWQ